MVEPLQQVTKAAIANNMTLICVWSDLVGRLVPSCSDHEARRLIIFFLHGANPQLKRTSRLQAHIWCCRAVTRSTLILQHVYVVHNTHAEWWL